MKARPASPPVATVPKPACSAGGTVPPSAHREPEAWQEPRIIGFVLPATATTALSKDPMIAEQAAIAASWAVDVVVVCSAIFAAFKDEFLGHEDPHWHKPNAVSVEVMSE